MTTLLALVPILLLVLLLTVGRWSAASAGLVSAVVAGAIAVLGFGYGGSAGVVPSLLGPLLEAMFVGATILWIIFPALWIHEYQSRTGAVGTLGRWFAGIGSDRRVTAIMVAWFFGLFLEGAAGFGTPVALAAPLLVALGFTPARALVLALVGHAAGVSFGAIGTPIAPLLALDAAIDPRLLSVMIVFLHASLGWWLAALVFKLAEPDAPARSGLSWVVMAWLCFFAPALLLAWSVGPELPTLGGALIGALLFGTFARWRRSAPADIGAVGAGQLLRAGLPYLAVLVLILATRLTPGAADLLRGPVLRWSVFGDFGGEAAPLYHPGTILLLGLGIAAAASSGGLRTLGATAGTAAARLPQVALALVSVLLLSRLMMHSGMIDRLASVAADSLGGGWILAAPAVGALGSFITGSATASNILFGGLQHAAASAAGVSPLVVLAAQGFGAAIGNIVAPHNIIAGAATVGLLGREGEALRRTLPICVAYAAAGGLLAFAVAALN